MKSLILWTVGSETAYVTVFGTIGKNPSASVKILSDLELTTAMLTNGAGAEKEVGQLHKVRY
jgi:hypothetical protein